MKTIAALALSALIVHASDSSRELARPKIGVALAGGSALGLAHVGVLQRLEEMHIPIDYIAGTSMGGLVAGLYATGMSSAEIIEFVRRIDWNAALSPSVSFRNLAFRRKEDSTQYPMAFEAGFKNRRFSLPSGLSSGEGVSLVIQRFAALYADMDSFDDLPTPFRCVAVDLVDRKTVVFRQGSLFDALRATMSLPAIFAPVRKDGMVLVDGGVANNLPVDVVRAMGADIVIAVALDVPADPKAFRSLLGIAGESISYMILANERPNIAAADIVIMPSLRGGTASDYASWEQFRKLGYEAVERKAEGLSRLQLSKADFLAHQQARASRRRPSSIRPDVITVEGDVAPRLKRAVIAALGARENGELSRAVLEEQMEKLTGAGRFETATYEVGTTSGRQSLRIKVREKSYGPPLLRPSIVLDGASGDGLRFGVGARLTFLDTGGPASEWRTDFSIGILSRLETEYYHRILGGKWFLAPRLGFTQEPRSFFGSAGARLAQGNERNYFGAIDAGYAFGRWQEFRMGYQRGYLKNSLNTGTTDRALPAGRYGFTHLTLRRDTRDNPLIPAKGQLAYVRMSIFHEYPLAVRPFATLEASMDRAFPVKSKFTILAGLRGAGARRGTGFPDLFRLGGVSNLSALTRNQLTGSRMYYGHAYVLRALSQQGPVAKFYGLAGYEIGRAWLPQGSARPRHDGIAGIAGATPLGAVFVGGAVGDQGDRKFLLRLGRVF